MMPIRAVLFCPCFNSGISGGIPFVWSRDAKNRSTQINTQLAQNVHM